MKVKARGVVVAVVVYALHLNSYCHALPLPSRHPQPAAVHASHTSTSAMHAASHNPLMRMATVTPLQHRQRVMHQRAQPVLTAATVVHAHRKMNMAELVVNVVADLCPHGMLPLAYGMSRGGGTGLVPALGVLLLFAMLSGYTMVSLGNMAQGVPDPTFAKLWRR